MFHVLEFNAIIAVQVQCTFACSPCTLHPCAINGFIICPIHVGDVLTIEQIIYQGYGVTCGRHTTVAMHNFCGSFKVVSNSFHHGCL